MILTGQEIRRRGIVQNATAASYRAVTYDLLVDKIYVPPNGPDRGHTNVDTYDVPPHGIVLLFSAETLQLPQDVWAQALPKTTLCEDGILILNTGVIDPGYQGGISGMAINFGAKHYRIKSGDAFLRLLFEDIRQPDPVDPITQSRVASSVVDYRTRKIAKAMEYPPSFLDIRRITTRLTRRVGRRVVREERTGLVRIVGAAAAFLAVIQILVALLPPRWYFSQERLTKEVLDEFRTRQEYSVPLTKVVQDQSDLRAKTSQEQDEMRKKMDGLERTIGELKDQITRLSQRR